MQVASIAHQDFFDLHIVAAIGRASVHRMAIVDTTAHCEPFDDFDAHRSNAGDVMSGVDTTL